MNIIKIATILVFSLATTIARADTLVLVQGYLGDAGSWRATGISYLLQQRGIVDAGHLSVAPVGVVEWPAPAKGKNRFYTIDLPTEAPVPVQASYLASYLERIAVKHEGDKITLAGHSAGGIVARMAMVSYPKLKVGALITIASPHRGTGAAEDGLLLASSPVGFFAPMFGAGTLNRSQGLYSDLVRERPGTFLNWLNTRKHPKAHYVSVMRTLPSGSIGDDVVPGWSQDMRGIAGLQDHQVTALVAPRPHELTIADGATILGIVAGK